jgi:hypothetical protein
MLTYFQAHGLHHSKSHFPSSFAGTELLQTPHLALARAPPPTLVDPNLDLEHPSRNPSKPKPKGKRRVGIDEAEGGDSVIDSGPERVKKPKGGEVRFWSTGVEIERDVTQREYGWMDAGGECNQCLANGF